MQNWTTHCLTPKHKNALHMKTCLLAGVGQLGEDPIPVWLKARRAEWRSALKAKRLKRSKEGFVLNVAFDSSHFNTSTDDTSDGSD